MTGNNFVYLTGPGVALAVLPALANQLVNAGLATILDRFAVDLSGANVNAPAWAKEGAVVLTLAASTPVTVDLTALGGVGDTSFATANEIDWINLGAHDVTISPGATNPLNGPLSGTAPAFTVPANARERWHSPAGWAVSGTVKTLKIDPGAFSGLIAICVGGA